MTKSSFKEAYDKIKSLFLNPTAEWVQIKKESLKVNALIGRFLIPLLLLYFVFSLFGNVLFSNDIEHTAAYKLVFLFARFIYILTGFFMSFLILSKVYSKLGIGAKGETIFTLLFYCYLVVWVAAALMGLLANYSMLMRFLHTLPLYGLFLFWVGSETLISPSNDKKFSLYTWSFFILIAIYLLVFFMLKKTMSMFVLIYAVTQL